MNSRQDPNLEPIVRTLGRLTGKWPVTTGEWTPYVHNVKGIIQQVLVYKGLNIRDTWPIFDLQGMFLSFGKKLISSDLIFGKLISWNFFFQNHFHLKYVITIFLEWPMHSYTQISNRHKAEHKYINLLVIMGKKRLALTWSKNTIL